MNHLITLVLISCFISQPKPIIVHNKKDKRLISYQDSLRRWQEYERRIKYERELLSKCVTLEEFDIVSRTLGYGGVDLPNTNNAQHLYTDKTKTKIDYNYQLLYKIKTKSGREMCVYSRVVPKPKIQVIYKPKPKKPIIIRDTIYIQSPKEPRA